MEVELNQLSDLFNGITFQFHFYSEGLFTFKSAGFLDCKGNSIQYEIDFFLNENNFFGLFMKFDELKELHQVFEVREIPVGFIKGTEVIYHEKYKCHSMEILKDGTCLNCGKKESDH